MQRPLECCVRHAFLFAVALFVDHLFNGLVDAKLVTVARLLWYEFYWKIKSFKFFILPDFIVVPEWIGVSQVSVVQRVCWNGTTKVMQLRHWLWQITLNCLILVSWCAFSLCELYWYIVCFLIRKLYVRCRTELRVDIIVAILSETSVSLPEMLILFLPGLRITKAVHNALLDEAACW